MDRPLEPFFRSQECGYGAGVLFISQAIGIELGILEQLTVVFTALLASIGAAGIPSAGLVMIFFVIEHR